MYRACISPALVRNIVAISIAGVGTRRELAKALNISIGNAQRVINTLESIGAIKVVRYGKQKIIASLNKKYFDERSSGDYHSSTTIDYQ
jgi:DNA-binding transcriptional regulator YhcF (GntR family)